MFCQGYMVIFTLCVLVNISYGAQAIRKPVPKPAELADQPGCYEPDLKTVLPYDKPYLSKDCSQYICHNNGEIVISSCGSVFVGEGQVQVKGNKSLLYPDCCDSVKPKDP
ncbi:uncharacterized protein LOC128674165 [Plodia interpunctella]|uniref:uncharacterized protein LOC128674165 n=1 Tax=Plodia interpunctella TaxID=58824 RepID=UPI00236854D6|nr:uncharacterized protein LOC128674165 [Plodia interpunctella]